MRFLKEATTVTATFDLEGVHSFPNVEKMLKQQPLKGLGATDVSFLKFPHRHRFYFEITVDVKHNDRDIEFIQLQRLIKLGFEADYLTLGILGATQGGCCNFGSKSCEDLGEKAIEYLIREFPDYEGNVSVSVFEDNENGATTSGYIYAND